MYLQTWNILSWTSVLCLTLSMLGEGQRRRSQLWFRYIRSITDRKSASHPPSWVLERSEKPTAHQQRGLRLKSIIKSHPLLINVSLPSLQTQNDFQRRGFPVRCCVGMMNTYCISIVVIFKNCLAWRFFGEPKVVLPLHCCKNLLLKLLFLRVYLSPIKNIRHNMWLDVWV